MARAPFEYEYQTAIADTPGNEGGVLFGFNGNNTTKEVYLDYVRDEDGNAPDANALTSEDNIFIDKIDKEIIIGK